MDGAVHIDDALPLNLKDQPVDGYEGACATDTGAGRTDRKLTWQS